MKKVKGFLFDTEEDKELLDHIESKGNQSNYIKILVKEDMKSESIQELVRLEVIKYLEETAKKINKIGNTDQS